MAERGDTSSVLRLLGRVAVGLPTVALALAVMSWTATLARVDVTFNRLPEIPESGIARADERNAYAAILKRLEAQDPGNTDVQKRLAVVLGQQHQREQARQIMLRAMQSRPAPADLYFLAMLEEKLGQGESATTRIRQAILLDPGNRIWRDFYLRLIGDRLVKVAYGSDGGVPADQRQKQAAALRRELGLAATQWAIRAPGDKNALFLMGNFYVGPPLNASMSYRCFLAGLALCLGPDAAVPSVIPPRMAIGVTVRQLLESGMVKPYPGVDLNAPALERAP